MALASIFTASFFSFLIITVLVVVHELGHVLMTYLCGGNIKEILITPLGGISKTFIPYSMPFILEFLILICGPIFQCFAYLFLILIFNNDLELITLYHFAILIFNLLPVYPLDGGKILCLFFQLLFSFKTSYYLIFFISFFMLILFYIFSLYFSSLNILFFTSFLFIKLLKEVKEFHYLYEKFLLERYLNPIYFSKSSIVFSYKNFKRWHRHLIKRENNYYLEGEYLEKRFKNC